MVNFSAFNFLMGVISGYIYAEGHNLKINESVLYVSLALFPIYVFLTRYLRLIWKPTALVFLGIVAAQWYVSIFFGVAVDVFIWKLSVGCMWILVTFIYFSKVNQEKVNDFCAFIFGFSLILSAFLIINIINFSGFRLSFPGDDKAPHVYASVLILVGAACVEMSNITRRSMKYFLFSTGAFLIFASILTSSKTSAIACALFMVFLLKKYFALALVVPVLMFALAPYLQSIFAIDFSRAIDFSFENVSISARLELLIYTLISSISNFGLPGYIDYPKHWIDTSLGSMISTFGVFGATFLLILILSQRIKINFPFLVLIVIFLVTEHLILPRILMPLTILIITIGYSNFMKLEHRYLEQKANIK